MHMGIIKQLLFSSAAAKIEHAVKRKQQHYSFVFVQANGSQLAQSMQILEKKQIRPVVGQSFPLNQVNEALENVTKRPAKGKTILTFK